MQAENHLLLCQRCIELNPIRAGMVADPADYRWSSYPANALGANDDARRAAYREIEAMTGQRRELCRRGRPRKRDEEAPAGDAGQGELPL